MVTVWATVFFEMFFVRFGFVHSQSRKLARQQEARSENDGTGYSVIHAGIMRNRLTVNCICQSHKNWGERFDRMLMLYVQCCTIVI